MGMNFNVQFNFVEMDLNCPYCECYTRAAVHYHGCSFCKSCKSPVVPLISYGDAEKHRHIIDPEFYYFADEYTQIQIEPDWMNRPFISTRMSGEKKFNVVVIRDKYTIEVSQGFDELGQALRYLSGIS